MALSISLPAGPLRYPSADGVRFIDTKSNRETVKEVSEIRSNNEWMASASGIWWPTVVALCCVGVVGPTSCRINVAPADSLIVTVTFLMPMYSASPRTSFVLLLLICRIIHQRNAGMPGRSSITGVKKHYSTRRRKLNEEQLPNPGVVGYRTAWML